MKGATMSKLDRLIEKCSKNDYRTKKERATCLPVSFCPVAFADSLISALKKEMEGFNGVAILRKQVDLAYNALKGKK
jgi:hypothetical protein